MRRCWPIRSALLCWWCWTRSPRPNGSRSCSMTCSTCRSSRSPRWSTVPPPPPASSPAGLGAGYAARLFPTPRPTPPVSGGLSRRSSPPPAAGTWPPSSPSSTRTRCSGRTAASPARGLGAAARGGRGRQARDDVQPAERVGPLRAGQRHRRRGRQQRRRAGVGHGLHDRGRTDHRDRHPPRSRPAGSARPRRVPVTAGRGRSCRPAARGRSPDGRSAPRSPRSCAGSPPGRSVYRQRRACREAGRTG